MIIYPDCFSELNQLGYLGGPKLYRKVPAKRVIRSTGTTIQNDLFMGISSINKWMKTEGFKDIDSWKSGKSHVGGWESVMFRSSTWRLFQNTRRAFKVPSTSIEYCHEGLVFGMGIMWLKQCHVYHPRVITIFMGGIDHPFYGVIYDIVLTTLLNLEFYI